jgi:protein-S-isoprenylcysteine O-methyltransferase Ste14
MGWLELKIPPPVVALAFGALMWAASPLVAPVEVAFGNRVGVAVVLASVGLLIDLVAIVTFWRARTTVNPMKPGATLALVTGGVYRFSRNPMYVGLVLFLLAWAVYLSSWLALLFVPVFVIYISRFQIQPEERAMLSLFGPDYSSYQAKVRRWL